jgi:hypothetical protein
MLLLSLFPAFALLLSSVAGDLIGSFPRCWQQCINNSNLACGGWDVPCELDFHPRSQKKKKKNTRCQKAKNYPNAPAPQVSAKLAKAHSSPILSPARAPAATAAIGMSTFSWGLSSSPAMSLASAFPTRSSAVPSVQRLKLLSRARSRAPRMSPSHTTLKLLRPRITSLRRTLRP